MRATLRPDSTFYPSPKMAMQAPKEKLTYAVLLACRHRRGRRAYPVDVRGNGSGRAGRLRQAGFDDSQAHVWVNVDLLWAAALVGA
jgi:hypothetical protein